MKKSSLKSPTFVLVLSLATIILVLSSCSSTQSMPAVQSSDTLRLWKQGSCEETRAERIALKTKDSVIIRERTIHDTVYITKEVYRDRQQSIDELHHATQTDTIVVTQWREKIIKQPPERYVPKFYKWCTGFLLGLLLVTGIVLALKWWWKRRL